MARSTTRWHVLGSVVCARDWTPTIIPLGVLRSSQMCSPWESVTVGAWLGTSCWSYFPSWALRSIPMEAEVRRNIYIYFFFLRGEFVSRPLFAPCKKLFLFNVLVLVLSIVKKGLQRLLPPPKGVWWSEYRSCNEYIWLQILKKSMSPFFNRCYFSCFRLVHQQWKADNPLLESSSPRIVAWFITEPKEENLSAPPLKWCWIPL